MAYETGSATDATDLLDKFRAFAAANGWTVNLFATQGTGKWLNIEKSGLVFNIVSDIQAGTSTDLGSYWLCYGATSYSSGAAYSAQPNSSGLSKVNQLGTSSITAYHFFAGTDYLYAAIEVTAGAYAHMHLGSLTKFGTYTGGAFLMGSCFYSTQLNNLTNQNHQIPWGVFGRSDCSNKIRADINGATNKWFTMRYGEAVTSLALGPFAFQEMEDIGIVGSMLRDSPNTFNGLSVLFPAYVFCGNSNNLYNPIGYAPDLRMVRMDNNNPAETVTIAGTDWMMFPVYQKPVGGGKCYGYAIKKG